MEIVKPESIDRTGRRTWYTVADEFIRPLREQPMFEKLKQMKELRDRAKMIQQRLREIEIRADSANGRVRVTMNGNQEIQRLQIDPDYLRQADRARIEQELAQTINEAMKKSQQAMASSFRELGGLPPVG